MRAKRIEQRHGGGGARRIGHADIVEDVGIGQHIDGASGQGADRFGHEGTGRRIDTIGIAIVCLVRLRLIPQGQQRAVAEADHRGKSIPRYAARAPTRGRQIQHLARDRAGERRRCTGDRHQPVRTEQRTVGLRCQHRQLDFGFVCVALPALRGFKRAIVTHPRIMLHISAPLRIGHHHPFGQHDQHGALRVARQHILHRSCAQPVVHRQH